MNVQFNEKLASALREFAHKVHADAALRAQFAKSPTDTVVAHLKESRTAIPEMFHAHAVNRANPLPEEPRLATIDRFVYIYRKDGLFEFKQVPGVPDGDDSILTNPQLGACCCCNCCAVEI